MKGALILTANFSEEAPFAYGEQHYTDVQFKSFLAWAAAHEIAHPLGCDDDLAPVPGILMGLRTPVEGVTVAPSELFQINLKIRKGVTQ